MLWQPTKLREVLELNYGKPLPKEDRDESGKYAAYGANGVKCRTNKFYCDKPSIIVGRKGSAGEITLVDESFWPLDVTYFITYDEEKYDLKFLFLCLSSLNLPSMAKGVKPGINRNEVYDIEFSFPSIEEQKRIVTILNKVFEGIDKTIANTEQNLINARELFESYLNKIFTQKGDGWTERRLNEICEITAKLIDPREERFLDLPHIGAGNMISQSDKLVEVKTARQEKLISGKFVFDDGVVLYSKIRPYLMKVCRPNFEGLCSADVYPLMPINETLESDFLFYLLLSKNFTDYAIKGSARAGMPKVNRTHLFNYTTHIPSVKIQNKLSAKIDKIYQASKDLDSLCNKKLNSLNELKQSLLQKAFAGELTNEPETKLGNVA